MSSSLLPAAGEQERATAVAPTSLERVKKRKVRLANPPSHPNRRPPMSTVLSNIPEWCQSKTFILANAVSTYDTSVCANLPRGGFALGNYGSKNAVQPRTVQSGGPGGTLV